MIPVDRWSVPVGRRAECAAASRRRDDRAGPRRRRRRSRRWRCRWSRRSPRPSRSRPLASPDVAARWACDRRTGAAANAFGVKTAAAAAGPFVATDDGQVRPARGLDPDRHPAGLEAGGDGGSSLDRWEDRRGRRDGQMRCRDPGARGRRHGARGSCSRPAVSGRPWTRLKAWIAWPAAPLTRLSSTPMARIRPVRGSWLTWIADLVAAGHVLGRGRARDHGHERLVGVGRGVQLVELGLGDRPRRADVAGRQDAPRHRDQVGQEVDRVDARVGRRVEARAHRRSRRAPARSRRRGGGRRCRTPSRSR